LTALASSALAAVIASAVTVVLVHRHDHQPTIPTSGTTHSTGPDTSLPDNEVTRVGEPTNLGGWTIVVEKFAVASVYEREPAMRGQKWLTTTLTLTNSGGASRSFDLQQITARYYQEGTWIEVPVRLGGSIGVGPRKTIREFLGFSVPTSAGTYSLVIRKDLESEKQSGVAAEIDLNCC
jgi:hypothetical protein